jgi:superfamily II DNA/RNA helicase
MADLGFLPVVRRLLSQTPRSGQRLLFSATLDAGVDVLVRQFLTRPVTHSVDSSLSPVSTMSHHVLHVSHDDRLPVLVDLSAAPGRTLVFTRTKHRAKTLTRRLVAAGVPAVELHGNLAQSARDRNLLAFSDGGATTLVATDIAARGIHVDDVALVIHADPPVEHKAYLHRSGRTARAGAPGTVVTLMTDDQVPDVRDLTRRAGIAARTTRLRPGHPLLTELAPGQRSFVTPPVASSTTSDPASGQRSRRTPAAPSGSSRTARRPRRAAAWRSGAGEADQATDATQPRSSGAAAFSSRTRVGSRRGR